MFCQMLADKSKTEYRYSRGNSSGTKTTQTGRYQQLDKTKLLEAGKPSTSAGDRP